MTLDPYLYYQQAHNRVVAAGYQNEINYWRDLPEFKDCTVERFFEEYIWCVINLGIREQTCRVIVNKFLDTLNPDVITCRFANKKQKAIKQALNEFVKWYGEVKCTKDPIAYLQTLPLIGETTKYHLARNIGIDCVKPDIHLKRLTAYFKYRSPYLLCLDIQRSVPYERLGTIDYVLWRDCNLRKGVGLK